MAVNSDGIYGTRPWKVFGEGPSTEPASATQGGSSEHHLATAFNERDRKPLSGEDVRFTTKGKTLYAFLMGWSTGEVKIRALADTGKIDRVELLGSRTPVDWRQQPDGLHLKLSGDRPSDHAVTLRISEL